MNNIVFFDGACRQNLLPLTFTRPVAEIRIGILTIREKWEMRLNMTASYLTEDYLSLKYTFTETNESLFLSGNLLPDNKIVETVKSLQKGVAVFYDGNLIAFRGSYDDYRNENFSSRRIIESVTQIENTYDIFLKNGEELCSDFELITHSRESQPLSITNRVIGSNAVFVEEGAFVECATINTQKGPVYIGKDVEIMEGSNIRGPFAACEHATVNMGCKIYGPTTIGPYCKVGGELNNVVMFGYSNKGHDGFLGNAVIGEWCNIGAGTEASNLKNDYSEIKLWNYATRRFARTGLQFCGLIMGDYSKAGINTMFNTATVVGVGCNIYGTGFPRNFVHSFIEGGNSGV
ncbi:MAG: putative sugar nucleotidyl transferase, partial [Bacteroidales bacterium]